MLSVALIKDNQVIKEGNYFLGLRHSERLLPTIKDILDASSFSLKDIDTFAIDIGPGSFTGLRIGLATLKGLTFGEKKKVIGISSLDALAKNAQLQLDYSDHLICPIIDARQDRVYTAFYEISKSNKLKRKTKYQVVKIGNLLKTLNKKKVVFLGDGLEKHQDFIAQQKKEVIFLGRKFWFPYASIIAKLGLEKFKRGKSDNIDSLSPMYLVPPVVRKK
ncbi:MAG: tRNA (adenosine(37)-N6)-threonylcarbamoyltransferase complex dimerization subunit type 1 TsaB [Candidatus Omnitrophica bacterium]|nr:tRNA (adenosine(37)-N6)-threonylcarbamoyltransferase complex dimerization subunit type 1 TsaB [Candidatus Omnitrophota bacterium]